MMRLLLPVLLAVIGTGLGIGAGILLKPKPAELVENPCGEVAPEAHAAEETHAEAEPGEATHEYVKMNNQFVVPVVHQDRVASLVVMSLSVEVPAGQNEIVFRREPKLRDLFLQVLFEHANVGGFDGTFTNASNLDVLRRSLLETAQKEVGPSVSDVLITDIVRQDV